MLRNLRFLLKKWKFLAILGEKSFLKHEKVVELFGYPTPRLRFRLFLSVIHSNLRFRFDYFRLRFQFASSKSNPTLKFMKKFCLLLFFDFGLVVFYTDEGISIYIGLHLGQNRKITICKIFSSNFKKVCFNNFFDLIKKQKFDISGSMNLETLAPPL
jgi:hypothetical protein